MPASHDHSRVATRYDGDGRGAARARAMAVLLYGLRGTPFVYQGEELGLPDAEIPPERVVDVDGRDPERAPIPWRPPSTAGPGAGFTSGEPWLPLVAGAEDLCVERQAADPRSTLALFRRAAALRAATPALQTGAQRMLDAGESVLAWLREEAGDRLVVALNFAGAEASLALSVRRDPAALDGPRARGGPAAAGGRAPAGTRGGRRPAAGRRQPGAVPSTVVVSRCVVPVDAARYAASTMSITCRACSAVAMLGVPSRIQSTSCMTSSKTCCSGSARWASVTCGSSQPARSPGSRRGSAAGSVTRSRPG